MTINLNLSSDQNQIVGSMSKVLCEAFLVSRLRGNHSGSPDQPRLDSLAQLGVFGLGSSEDHGGSGFSIVEEMLLFTELGRHLVTPNALAATIAARLAMALGKPQIAKDIIAGDKIACIANATGSFEASFAVGNLGGTTVHLLDPQGASYALLWNDAGMALIDCKGLETALVASADRSVVIHRCVLPKDAVLGHISAADTTLVRQAHLLLSAMLLGMAEATRDMAVEYAKIRVQFGQPIGAFQAVKHRCATMAIEAQALKAQIAFAAIAERDGWPDAPLQNDAARMLAARCALANAGANIQIHGGIGFTAECDAHLYLVRAHLYENIGGTRNEARARLTRSSGPLTNGPEKNDLFAIRDTRHCEAEGRGSPS